jgi:hypothetical protein
LSIISDNKKLFITLTWNLQRENIFKLKSWRSATTKTMKKASILLIALFFGIAINGFSQTTAPAPKADFFVGKWEITIFGTPNGDSKMITDLIRKDGKLTGELKNLVDSAMPAIPITSIDEKDGEIEIAFSASGYDVTLPLKKEDDDNLKGQLMGMFDAKAKRVK